MSNLIASLPTQQRDRVKVASPPWLQTGNGEKFQYTLDLMGDLLLEKCNQAQKIRMPGLGDPTQLPYLSADRLLVQGPAESNAAFVTRLQNAFAAWKKAGSRIAVAQQLQAYLENLQPGVAAVLPEFAIVGGNSATTAWSTQYVGDAIGAPPTIQTVGNNWNWDGKYQPWRSWLILYMSSLPTGQVATGVATFTASAAAGVLGQNVGGVWVPGTSGKAINPGSVLVAGMTGANLTAKNVGQYLNVTSGSHSYSDGTFQILQVVSPTSCYIANPNAPGGSTDLALWSISYYPYIAPGPVWGTPDILFGQGQNSQPPKDLGSNVGGVWQPTTSDVTYQTSISFGLSCSPLVIQSIRQLLQRWKSATTWYPYIIIAFDGGTGAAGSAFSPNSSAGSGNPDGTFGGHGKNVGGVWVPNRLVSSLSDAYCQGTGSWSNCSVQNVT